ncbi:MAG: MCE family protein [Armatimonadetes bacterium]|nr:MCE family protein [Armatimonadota bacterium]
MIVFLALVALAIIYWFFGGLGLRRGTYQVCAVFDDVLKLARGAEVRMAGVRVGIVDEIGLTPEKKARVEMLISRQYEGAIPVDSRARITTGGLTGVGDYYVEIVPGSSKQAVKPGECVQTAKVPKLDDLLVQVRDLVDGLQTSMQSVNEIVQDPDFRRSVREIVKNVETSTQKTARLVEDVRSLLAQNRPELEQLLRDAGTAASNFAEASRDVRLALDRGGAENIQQTLTRAARAAENLEAASISLRRLAEDEEVTAQIREAIRSASEAAKGASEVVERIQRILGRRRRAAEEPRPGPVPGRGSRVDFLVKSESGDFRVDYNLTVPGRDDDFYRVGLFDLGENTRLNLQLGKILDSRSAFRYGLYASRIGVGYDRRLDRDIDLQLDLFRPNDPRLEAKLRYDFSPDFGAWIGVEDVFGEGGALFGLQYRR